MPSHSQEAGDRDGQGSGLLFWLLFYHSSSNIEAPFHIKREKSAFLVPKSQRLFRASPSSPKGGRGGRVAGVWAYTQQEVLNQFKLVKLVVFELFVIVLSQVWKEKSKISNCEARACCLMTLT